MASVTDIETALADAFPGGSIEVADDRGDGYHFSVTVESERFAGAGRVAQHRMVYAALQPWFDDGSLHAVSITTNTPQTQGSSQ